MADRAVDHLLIGGGAAAAACAEALRDGGATGSILLVGREPDPPYERPPASKSYLRGESSRADALLHDEAWWAAQGVELLLRTSAMKLDTAARSVTLSTKETVGYGQALVATGANVRRLRLEGGGLDGIHYLRTLGTADAIRADLEGASHVVLVGGSYIACEVAASLTMLGKRCTLVMEEDAPLSRGFGATAGAFAAELLRGHGIELVCGDPAESFLGSGERVEGVVCRSGRVVEGDGVVMGTGAVPDVMLARAAGLEIGSTGGVACDRSLRTSAPGVWAAGDVCEYDSVLHGGRVRIEHYEVARSQGRAAGEGMLGGDEPYAEVPYFWTDIGDWVTLEYVGVAASGSREVVRGTPGDGAFSITFYDGDRVVGALAVGRSEDLDAAGAAIRAHAAPAS